eukprot:scaffold954_cov173-Ochromonas_danica.AAC.44
MAERVALVVVGTIMGTSSTISDKDLLYSSEAGLASDFGFRTSDFGHFGSRIGERPETRARHKPETILKLTFALHFWRKTCQESDLNLMMRSLCRQVLRLDLGPIQDP